MVYRALYLPDEQTIKELKRKGIATKGIDYLTKCVDNVVSPITKIFSYSRIVCPGDWSYDWMILNLEEYERKQKRILVEKEREEFKNAPLRSKIFYILRGMFESEN